MYLPHIKGPSVLSLDLFTFSEFIALLFFPELFITLVRLFWYKTLITMTWSLSFYLNHGHIYSNSSSCVDLSRYSKTSRMCFSLKNVTILQLFCELNTWNTCTRIKSVIPLEFITRNKITQVYIDCWGGLIGRDSAWKSQQKTLAFVSSLGQLSQISPIPALHQHHAAQDLIFPYLVDKGAKLCFC